MINPQLKVVRDRLTRSLCVSGVCLQCSALWGRSGSCYCSIYGPCEGTRRFPWQKNISHVSKPFSLRHTTFESTQIQSHTCLIYNTMSSDASQLKSAHVLSEKSFWCERRAESQPAVRYCKYLSPWIQTSLDNPDLQEQTHTSTMLYHCCGTGWAARQHCANSMTLRPAANTVAPLCGISPVQTARGRVATHSIWFPLNLFNAPQSERDLARVTREASFFFFFTTNWLINFVY